MNNQELIKLRNEIMDCFTCDEEIMEGGDSVIESRIDKCIRNRLILSRDWYSLKWLPETNKLYIEDETGKFHIVSSVKEIKIKLNL